MQRELITILRSIFLKNDDLAIFSNSITSGKLTPRGVFYVTEKIRFRKDAEQDEYLQKCSVEEILPSK